MRKIDKVRSKLILIGFIFIIIAIILFLASTSSTGIIINILLGFFIGGIIFILVGWILSLFSSESDDNDFAADNIDKTIDHNIQLWSGVCPKCFKKISRIAKNVLIVQQIYQTEL